MPTADATLLPPPYSSSSFSTSEERAEEHGSHRSLDDVGVETILGAMHEQKRRSSQPSFPAVLELSDEELHDEDQGPPGGRTPSNSEVFLKAR